jgi:predicted amidohydrolase/ribosomal protein S18 acetylase RimI-like enzyme
LGAVATSTKGLVRNQKLTIRRMRVRDVKGIQDLQRKCFPGIAPWTESQIRSQLDTFADGQIVIEYGGRIIATSSSLIVNGAEYRDWHTFDTVSGDGQIDNHDPDGDTLYGIDIAVDPEHRGLRLARRLYDARKDLTQELNLRGMLIAGRIPGYHKHADKLTADEYARRVVKKQLKDQVLTAQLANGFAIRRVLANYLPSDAESKGYAVLMEWLNPTRAPLDTPSVRVAAMQYQMRPVDSFEAFAKQCEFFVDTAGDYRSDFVLFPERLTNQLLSLVPASRPALAARRLSEYTNDYEKLFTHLSIKYNVNIIAGSHLTVEAGNLYNVAYLFRRDGTHAKQYKLHATTAENTWWGVSPGERQEVFETDCGKIAIFVCYDVEFPELARIAASKGAKLFFVPVATDLQSGYTRVRYCTQSRCIENHAYAVMSAAVGNLPFVVGTDIHYGQACILTPADVQFARNGIAEEATPNVETMLIHELDMEVLRRTRRSGTVRPWHDRRKDLYKVTWRENDEERSV